MLRILAALGVVIAFTACATHAPQITSDPPYKGTEPQKLADRVTEQSRNAAKGPVFGTLVSAVDDDGNEIAGIPVPELRVPLATHTGWNLRHPEIGGKEQLLYFAGAMTPFARTRQSRQASGDPRPSGEERYPSRDAYLERVRRAALDRVAAR